MKQVILFFMTYVFVFILYQVLIVRKTKEKKIKKGRKPKRVKNTKPIEVSFLEKKYHIDLDKINYNKLLLVISLVSSLDITIIVTLVLIFNSYILKVLVGFLLTFPIIYVSYELIGRYYQKKGLIKND